MTAPGLRPFWLSALALTLVACAAPQPPQARLAATVGPAGVELVPRVSTRIGGLGVSASPRGARLGTAVGPLSLGVGL